MNNLKIIPFVNKNFFMPINQYGFDYKITELKKINDNLYTLYMDHLDNKYVYFETKDVYDNEKNEWKDELILNIWNEDIESDLVYKNSMNFIKWLSFKITGDHAKDVIIHKVDRIWTTYFLFIINPEMTEHKEMEK